jgi:hypothetical protein
LIRVERGFQDRDGSGTDEEAAMAVMRQTPSARQFIEEFKRVFTPDALAAVRARAEEMAREEGKAVLGRSHLRAAWEEFNAREDDADGRTGTDI